MIRKMFIYNNNNLNNFKKGYKIAQRKRSHLSLKSGTEGSTASSYKSTKHKRLKKENIEFLQQLGFEVKKK